MNDAQLHLLINHLPVLGVPFGLTLGAWALVRRSEDLLRAALGVLVLAALATGAAYLSGEPAEELVEHQAGVGEAFVERHEALAAAATVAAGLLGGLALAVLAVGWVGRRHRVPRPLAAFTFAGALGVAVLLGYTAHVGGQIRHAEIRPAQIRGASDGVQADDATPAYRYEDDD
jgi:hypothetical protein